MLAFAFGNEFLAARRGSYKQNGFSQIPRAFARLPSRPSRKSRFTRGNVNGKRSNVDPRASLRAAGCDDSFVFTWPRWNLARYTTPKGGLVTPPPSNMHAGPCGDVCARWFDVMNRGFTRDGKQLASSSPPSLHPAPSRRILVARRGLSVMPA